MDVSNSFLRLGDADADTSARLMTLSCHKAETPIAADGMKVAVLEKHLNIAALNVVPAAGASVSAATSGR